MFDYCDNIKIHATEFLTKKKKKKIKIYDVFSTTINNIIIKCIRKVPFEFCWIIIIILRLFTIIIYTGERLLLILFISVDRDCFNNVVLKRLTLYYNNNRITNTTIEYYIIPYLYGRAQQLLRRNRIRAESIFVSTIKSQQIRSPWSVFRLICFTKHSSTTTACVREHINNKTLILCKV